MNDTIGLIYDDEAAAYFAHKMTGIDASTIAKFMLAKDRYDLALGILPSDPGTDLDAATARTIRAAHPDLFPAKYVSARYLCIPLQRRFVALDTGLDEETIARLQDADDEYMRRVGII